MRRGKVLLGGSVLCALAFGLLGASNALAVGKGLTAVTCTNAPGGAGTGKFATNHCETPEVAGSNFETVEISPGTHTEVTVEAVGKTILNMKILTLEAQLTCNKMTSSGEVTNELVGEEHRAHWTNVVQDYSECTVHLKGSTTESCEIENKIGNTDKNTVQTKSLTLTTGPEHKVTLKPTEGGTELTRFKLLSTGTNCHLPAMETTITGETTALANTTKHSHLTFNPAEGTGTGINIFGNPATFEGTWVSYMKGTENTIGLTTFTPTE